MFSFFARKPAVGVIAVVLVLGAGVVLAHRSSKSPHKPLALSLSKAKKAAAAPPSWRTKVDLRHAVTKGARMEQRLANGTRLELTLDPRLQQTALKILERYQVPYGGIVAYDIRSGELKALAGRSERDPKLGAQRLCLTPWAPAASVFKVITAAGLLSRGVPSSTSVCYHGGSRGLRAHHLREMPKIDTTCRTLSDAIAKSINPIMAKLSTRYLDRNLLLAWSQRFGFNKSIPFDLPVVPSKAEIPANKLERARTAAGFWHTEISVLHGAVIAGVPASGGLVRWPHLVRKVVRKDGRVIRPERPESRRIMPRDQAKELGAMMARTVSPIGSGRRGFISRRGKYYLGDFTVAGKTGSLSRRNPRLLYSWFVGFAPVNKPEIAFAVLLGNPPRWRIKASVAARMLLAEYLEQKKGKTKRRPRPAKIARKR
jgi:peptidoglycan glycosyltransferase